MSVARHGRMQKGADKFLLYMWMRCLPPLPALHGRACLLTRMIKHARRILNRLLERQIMDEQDETQPLALKMGILRWFAKNDPHFQSLGLD